MIFHSLPIKVSRKDRFRITSKFGPRNTGIKGASTNHKGVDIGRDVSLSKTQVCSVARGVVSANYWNAYRGWVVVVKHDDTWSTLYQHLKEKCALPVGTEVLSGTVLGLMGNSSDKKVLSVSMHLHFELRKNGTPIDPLPALQNISEEVLDMTQKELETLITQKVSEILAGKDSTPSNWAKDTWDKATKEGLVDGSRPKGYVTREQMAQVIFNSRKEG